MLGYSEDKLNETEDERIDDDFDNPVIEGEHLNARGANSMDFLNQLQSAPMPPKPHGVSQVQSFYPYLDKSDKEIMDRIEKREQSFRQKILKFSKGPREKNPYFLSKDAPRPLDLDNPEHFGRVMNFISHDPERDENDTIGAEDISIEFDFSEVLKIGRHSKITANGRQFSYSAMVLVGTGTGTAGLGYGIGATVVKAVEDAEKNAMKNLLSIKFFKSNNIGKSFEAKYKKTKLWVRSLPIGYGTLAPPVIRRILEAFGFEDVSLGWKGSKNIHTKYRVIFKAFMENCESEEEVAKKLGRKLFKRTAAFYKTRE